eukprot:4440802-Prymnesium_polylepis.2
MLQDGAMGRSIFIATYSLTEASLQARAAVRPLLRHFERGAWQLTTNLSAHTCARWVPLVHTALQTRSSNFRSLTSVILCSRRPLSLHPIQPCRMGRHQQRRVSAKSHSGGSATDALRLRVGQDCRRVAPQWQGRGTVPTDLGVLEQNKGACAPFHVLSQFETNSRARLEHARSLKDDEVRCQRDGPHVLLAATVVRMAEARWSLAARMFLYCEHRACCHRPKSAPMTPRLAVHVRALAAQIILHTKATSALRSHSEHRQRCSGLRGGVDSRES